ncbi:MAG: hypothetical protein U0800_14335 [Isosphaeraceae bacterium]
MSDPTAPGIPVSITFPARWAGGQEKALAMLDKMGLVILKSSPGHVYGRIPPDDLEHLADTEGLDVQIESEFQLDPREWQGFGS